MKLRQALSSEQIAQGFNGATDIFQHGDLATRLTTLFSNLSGGSVCLLDGRWGTGKSTFVRQWSAELGKSGIKNIYFDAFSSDYIDTPFTALAGTFVRAAHEAKRSGDPKVQRFLETAAKVGKALAATTAKVGLKAATLGTLDGSEIENFADTIAEGLGEIAESSVKKLLEEHAERETQFEAMRTAFAELTTTLRNDSGEENGSPLIVFIDELDRCRPDFSLGILEILKHFFNVDRVHFVLVTSKSYLEFAVNGKYGFGEASSEYLEKFYDFVVLFDINNSEHEAGSVSRFVNLTLDRFIPEETQDSHDFKKTLLDYCMAFRLTLRQIENVCINACIAYLSVQNARILKPGFLIAFVSMVKAVELPMYRKLSAGSLSWREAKSFLERGDWVGNRGERLEKIIQWHLDPDIDVNDIEWKHFGGGRWEHGIARLDMLKYIANRIVDRFSGTATENSA